MSTDLSIPANDEPGEGFELVPCFTGRAHVAFLRVFVDGECVVGSKVDLAREEARRKFANTVAKEMPAVNSEEVGKQLLKLANDRVTSLEKSNKLAAERGDEPNLTDLLVKIAFEGADLFHDKDQIAYASIAINGHRETYPVRCKNFRFWLRMRLREEHEKSAYPEAVATAIEECESKALFEGEEFGVYVRLAWHDGAIYVDMADDRWRVIRIAADGWTIINHPPVRFIRPRGLLPLSEPVSEGSINDLKPFANVASESDFVLVVALILGAYQTPDRRRDYPVGNINAEHGTGKTFLSELIKSLVDPNSTPLRSLPGGLRDLAISANHQWFLCFDNLSKLSDSLSDAICRLSTGGGFSTRTLYENREEELFQAQRPLLINGIDDVVTRPDLVDRCINLTLAPLPNTKRKKKSQLVAEFEEVRPRILGAIFDAISCALRSVASVELDEIPRMSDFAAWVTAAEPALGWEPKTFIKAYRTSSEAASELAIEASAIGPAILDLMKKHTHWSGTAKELLAELEDHHTDDRTRKRKGWPKSPRGMSAALRRLTPNLRAKGIEAKPPIRTGHGRRREHVLEKSPAQPSAPSANAAQSTQTPIPADGFIAVADGSSMDPTTNRPHKTFGNSPETLFADGADGADGSVGLPEDNDSLRI